MKKLLYIVAIIGIVCTIVLPITTALAAYMISYDLSNTSGTDYNMIALISSGDTNADNNTWMANNVFELTTGRDTEMSQGGTVTAHMLTDNKTLAAVSTNSGTSDTITMTTHNTATDLDILTGYNGYCTILDAAALEMGASFEEEIDGYVDTTDVGADLIIKDGAYGTYVSATNNISSYIIAAGTTTFNILPAGVGDATDIANVIGSATHWGAVDDPVGAPDDAATYISHLIPAGEHFDYYTTTYADDIHIKANISSVTVYFRYRSDAGNTAKVRPVLRLNGVNTLGTQLTQNTGGAWTNANEVLARPGGGTWTESDIDDLQIGIGLEQGTAASYCTQVYIVVTYYDAALEVTAAGFPPDDYNIITTADGADFKIYIDTIEEDTIALGGVSVKNNTSNYVLMSNATPYLNEYNHSVGGVLIVHYAPNDIVHGTAYDTGTVTVTNGDATVEGAGGMAWLDYAITGGIFVSADGAYYVIDSVTDNDTLELTTVYAGGTLAGQTYNVYGRLIDREGASQDAAITWGANPANVDMNIVSFETVASGGGIGILIPDRPDTIQDINPDLDPVGVAPNNPLSPLFEMWSDLWDVPDITGWLIAAMLVVIGSFILSYAYFRHLGLSTIVSCVFLGLFSLPNLHVLPTFGLIIGVVGLIAGIVMEAKGI